MVRAVGWLVGGCPKLIDVLLFFPFQPRSLYLTTTLDCGKKEDARPLFLFFSQPSQFFPIFLHTLLILLSKHTNSFSNHCFEMNIELIIE